VNAAASTTSASPSGPHPAAATSGATNAEPADPDGANGARTFDPESWTLISIPELVSGSNGLAQLIPIDWTSLWNYQENTKPSDQYQEVVSEQYHPVNINIAIRIRSPGRDGPVTQTNVALTVAGLAALLGATGGSGPAGLNDGPPAVASFVTVESPVTIVHLEATASVLPDASVPPEAVDGVLTIDPEPAADIPRAPTSVVVLPPERPLTLAAPMGAVLVGGAPSLARSRGVGWGSGTLAEADERAAGLGYHPSASRGAKAPRRPSRPRWSVPPPRSVVLLDATPAGASVAPATGGSSSGGGIPIFLLALPFLAAVLDLAWRIALARARWPSGHRARALDDPG
jgi:hypothetical protein